MPTYDYKCDNCGFAFEEFQSMNDDLITKCPKCGGKVQRLISSGAGLIFKGSGFYLTDYKKSNTSPSSASNETKPAKTEKVQKPKTDKPAPVKTEEHTK